MTRMSDYRKKKREEEKERLMNEVLNKRRDMNTSTDAKIELRTEAEKNAETIDTISKEVNQTSSFLEKGIQSTDRKSVV